jgi:hypothetical protein
MNEARNHLIILSTYAKEDFWIPNDPGWWLSSSGIIIFAPLNVL